MNLPQDKAQEYRAQAQRLCDKLSSYVDEHPDFTLRKMLLSGSLAKGTALRSLNDIDVACYISGADAPHSVDALLTYLAERLRKAFPNFAPDQVQPQTYSVTVSFRGTGLRAYADRIVARLDDEVVAEHPRFFGKRGVEAALRAGGRIV